MKLGWLAALVAVAAVVGAVAYAPRPAEALTGVTKSCTAVLMNGVATGANTCTLTVSGVNTGFAHTVTLANGTGAATITGTPTATAPAGCLVAIAAVTGTGFQFTVSQDPAMGAPMCPASNTVTITETLNATMSGTVTQTVLDPFAGTSFTATATVQAPAGGVGPFTTTITVGGTPPNACPVTVTLTPGETEDIVCILEINDNSPTPDLVSSGIVNVTIGTNLPSGIPISNFIVGIGAVANLSESNIVEGATANVRCGAVNTTDTCDFVGLVIRVRGLAGGAGSPVTLPFTTTINVTANYVPDNPMLNTPANLVSSLLATVITQATVAGFAGNDLVFVLRCLTPTAAAPFLAEAVTGTLPGPIGGTTVLAIGVLPSFLVCEAGFQAPGDQPTAAFRPAAPGTIEVSSLNGTLIDLRGGISTNLRIGCGGGATVVDPLATINPNTCLGVRFAVLGAGVGFVELRARYEPSSAAAAAGVLEREVSGQVAFVAPPATISPLLNPNPVGVGQTGTATARFNRVVTFAGELLINPSTGAPLAVNLGTPLNGTVTFTSSNPSVASWTGVGAQSAELTTGIIPGTSAGILVTTAASISVRCGSATALVGAQVTLQSFANFFGGCLEASAQYRGNAVGLTDITMTFVADLPGAFGATGAVASNVQPLLGLFGSVTGNTARLTLEVVNIAATTQRLVPGCNNVVAPANETPQQVAARVDPASAVISIWKQVPGTTTFQGAAISTTVPAGVSNLTMVNALDAIFICVNAAATYRVS